MARKRKVERKTVNLVEPELIARMLAVGAARGLGGLSVSATARIALREWCERGEKEAIPLATSGGQGT